MRIKKTNNYELESVRFTTETKQGLLYADVITLRLKNGAGTDYFTPHEELMKILSGDTWRVSVFSNGGRLRCDCWKNRRNESFRFHLHELAYGCYTGQIHAETLMEDMKRFQDWKNSLGLEVDHADSNVHNNTAANLSVMLGSLNGSKKEVVARFVYPYSVNSAYCDGEYRVRLETATEQTDSEGHNNLLGSLGVHLARYGIRICGDVKPIGGTVSCLCKDAESYVACLRRLYDTRVSWCDPEHTPRENRAANKESAYWAGEIKRSVLAQAELLLADRSDFQPFSVEEVST